MAIQENQYGRTKQKDKHQTCADSQTPAKVLPKSCRRLVASLFQEFLPELNVHFVETRTDCHSQAHNLNRSKNRATAASR
jgi:hypothetical protein